MEHVTLFMFLPGTVIHAIYPAWNQQGSVWLTNSESPSKMLTVCVLYWLLKNWPQCFSSNLIYSFQLQENSFQHQRVRDWTESICDIWLFFFLMLSLSFFASLFLWNTDTTTGLFRTPQHLLPLTSLKAELPVWKLCACVCLCACLCACFTCVTLPSFGN